MTEVDQAEVIQAPAQENYTQVIADIVSAYVSNNSIRMQELPELIASVHQSLAGLGHDATTVAEAAKREPAVPIKKSVHNDYLISLIDGKKYSTLRRHIGTHGMTVDEYRTAFGLPHDYPIVAPAYSAKRSALAKEIGLGNFRNGDTPKPEKLVPKEPGKRGRPRKAA